MSTAAARKNQYGPMTYGDLAYDLERAGRESRLRHAGEPRREEAVQVREAPRVQVRQRQQVSLFAVMGFAAVAVMAVALLFSYVQLTVISDSVVELQSQLSELETENVSLTAKYQQVFEPEAVRAAAEAAGMSKPSSSQIFYIDLSGEDKVEIYQKEEEGLWQKVLTSLDQGVCAVVEYFN